MNQTPTKAMHGKTSYEAAFGKKPDLSEVEEWGEKVWVRIEGGNKLGGRVREGQWMGISENSKGIPVYWPDKKTALTERNIYYDKQTCQPLVSKRRSGMALSKQSLTYLYPITQHHLSLITLQQSKPLLTILNPLKPHPRLRQANPKLKILKLGQNKLENLSNMSEICYQVKL
jgi:hypothetical protein